MVHVVLLAWTAVEVGLCLWNELLYTKGDSAMDLHPKGGISEGLIDGWDSPARPAPCAP